MFKSMIVGVVAAVAVAIASLTPSATATAAGGVTCAHLAWVAGVHSSHVRSCGGGSGSMYYFCTNGGRYFQVLDFHGADGTVGHGAAEQAPRGRC